MLTKIRSRLVSNQSFSFCFFCACFHVDFFLYEIYLKTGQSGDGGGFGGFGQIAADSEQF